MNMEVIGASRRKKKGYSRNTKNPAQKREGFHISPDDGKRIPGNGRMSGVLHSELLQIGRVVAEGAKHSRLMREIV